MPTSNVVDFYLHAKQAVIARGFGGEYEWQLARALEPVTKRDFLREYAWVVLNCGFREVVVRRIFPFVSMAFYDFDAAEDIRDRGEDCVALALSVFANRRKLEAIVCGAELAASLTDRQLRIRLDHDPSSFTELPYIGPVTLAHLLKNLGADVAKNDRHLARLSSRLGFEDASTLCGYLSSQTGEPVAAIDVVLWRFCTA